MVRVYQHQHLCLLFFSRVFFSVHGYIHREMQKINFHDNNNSNNTDNNNNFATSAILSAAAAASTAASVAASEHNCENNKTIRRKKTIIRMILMFHACLTELLLYSLVFMQSESVIYHYLYYIPINIVVALHEVHCECYIYGLLF